LFCVFDILSCALDLFIAYYTLTPSFVFVVSSFRCCWKILFFFSKQLTKKYQLTTVGSSKEEKEEEGV